MSRIDLHIVGTANFAQAEASIARLKAQIASINAMGVISPTTSRNMQSTFANLLNTSGMFQARMVNLTSETEKFGRALERGNLRGMQYFRAGSEYLRKQQGQIRSLAKEQVRMQQTRGYGFGDGRAVAVTPKGIDQAIHKQQILNQQHKIFREVVRGGATQLINWGKNTQWAGRQLTVGLTVPLAIFGTVAGKMFMDIDKQLTRMVKVYGDASKGMVNSSELQKIRADVAGLAQELASSMGVAATETAGVAADIAATGKQGEELLSSTREAMRLSVLGEVDRQEAMRATLALQSAFNKDTQGLTESINFLNAVENQTSATLNDLVEGIVKAGPVVKGLGGDVEELALMMVAMREGGIPASEAANAIKSSLASLINPTKQTTQVLGEFGVDIKDIVDKNAGDVIGTLVDLQTALSGLDDLSRQRSIEQIFGKFQFSRINALLANLGKAGGQTQQVMELAGMSTIQLAETADRELKLLTESASGRFSRAVEGIKASLIPIGESFVELGTMILNFAKGIVDAFNNLPEPIQGIIKLLGAITALAGPLIMMVGIFGNFFGYIVKAAGAFLALRKGARGVYEYYTPESVAARNMTELVSKGMYDQTTATKSLKAAIDSLTTSLASMAAEMAAVGAASASATGSASTMAAAARSAMASSYSLSPAALIGSAVAGKRSTDLSGYYRSHMVPVSRQTGQFNDPSGERFYRTATPYAAQVSATLLPSSFSQAQTFQEQMQRGFALKAFYGEGAYAGMSRSEILGQMAQTKGGAAQDAFTKLQNQPNAKEQMAALIPTRQAFAQSTSAYLAQLKVLSTLPQTQLKTLSDQMRAAIAANNPEAAANLIRQKISENQALFNRYSTGYQKFIMNNNMSLEQLINRLSASEMRMLSTMRGPGQKGAFSGLDLSGGSGYERFLYGMAGGGHGTGVVTQQQAKPDIAQQKLNLAIEKAATSMNARAETVNRLTAQLQQADADILVGNQLLERGIITRGEFEKDFLGKRIAVEKALEEATRNLALSRTRVTRAEDASAGRMISQIFARSGVESLGDSQARGQIARLLRQQGLEIIENTASIQKTTVNNTEFAVLVDKAGITFAALDMNTKELIMAEELAAKGINLSGLSTKKEIMSREKLIQELNEQAISHNLSQSALSKLTNWLNGLSQETIETIESLQLVQMGARKAAVELSQVDGKTITSPGAGPGGIPGGRMGGAAMGLGMAAGMGMMFLPQDGGAGSKIGGGALMGASMGAMIGSMFTPLGGVIGLVAGGIAGAAIPAITSYAEQQQKVNDELVKFGQSMSGASSLMTMFGKELGRRSPLEKLNESLTGLNIPEELQQTAKSILETNAGKAMLASAKATGGSVRQDMLMSQLQQLTLTEVFTPEEAKAVANELAIQLGDPLLGKSLVDGIVSVLGEDGQLIKDAISAQFIETLPDLAAIAANMPQMATTELGRNIYVGNTDELKADMSLTAGILKQITEAEAMVRLSFQKGEISLQEYNDQMALVNEKSIAAKATLEQLMLVGGQRGANLIGVESILGDIASIQGYTEEYDKVVEKVKEVQSLIGTTDVFAIPLQTAGAYGQLAAGDLQQFKDLILSDNEIQAKVTAIFDQDGTEEYALEIIKMINAGMAPEKIQVILETQGVTEGIKLISDFNMIAATLPPVVQAEVIGDVNYDPVKMNEFIGDYDYINSLPDSKKELKAAIFGNSELEVFMENWKDLQNMSSQEIKSAIFQYLVTGTFVPPTITDVGFSANEVADFSSPLDAGAMAAAATESSSGGSGGGSSGGSGGGSGSTEAETKAIEEKYDRQIEAQQKLIDKINEERDARQKVLDVQKEAMNFALREADLEAQIARAKAEGDVAKAALLQGQLESEKKQYLMDEAERRRQEQEDARIKRAEEQIERLEERKKKELDKIRDASSGGGGSSGGGAGGAGGLSAEEQANLQKKIQFINDQLMAAIETTTVKGWTDKIYAEGASAFWDSEPVKKYKEELLKLGVPIDVINQNLEAMFDSIVTEGAQGTQYFEQIKTDLEEAGLAGETAARVLPNIFAILRDPSMTEGEAIKQIKEQLIDAGASGKEADRIIRKFLNIRPEGEIFKLSQKFKDEFALIKDELDPEAAKIISEEFLKGINNGLTESEIFDNIKQKLTDAYTPEFTKGMSKDEKDWLIQNAQTRAETEITAFEQWYKENPVKLPPAEVEIKPVFSGGNPVQPGSAAGSGPGGAMPVDELASDGGKGAAASGAAAGMPGVEEGKLSAQNVISGYATGLAEADTGAIQETYRNIFVLTAQNALQSNSPSLVFEALGGDAMQGFLNGINSFGTDGIAAAILGIVNVVNQGMTETPITVPPLSPTGTGAGAIWASNFNDIVAEVLGYGVINSAFSAQITLMMETFRQIITGESGINFVITEEATLAAESLYTILTERMQETADQINEILRTTLTGYAFDIVGVPKIYVAPGTEGVWSRIIPNFASFPTTGTMPAETVEKAEGGYISGPGGPTDDLIPAMLSDGEYVIKASSVKHYGTGFLDEVNAGKFAEGGLVRLNPDNMTILGEKMADWMNQFAGVPYNSGAAWADGPENGWGCATATRWLYDRFAGINIGDDSLSAAQYASGVGKQVSDTMPGDQQFFYYANGVNVENPINHTGVAQSSGTMYHASGGSVGSYANDEIDTGARALAASRAGGTAQKRYLPETIGGMGMPVGYLKNGGFIRKLAGGGIAKLFSTNINKPSGANTPWPEDVENPYPEDEPFVGMPDDMYKKWLTYDFQTPYHQTSFGFKVPLFWMVDTTGLYTSTGPDPDDVSFDGEEWARRYKKVIEEWSGIEPTWQKMWNKKPGGKAFSRGGILKRAMGGMIKNGNVYGQGGPTDDTVLAMLSNGEYVMSAYSVNKYGKDFMQKVNSGTLAEAAAGGLVSKYPSYVANLAMGGMATNYSRGGMVDANNTNVEYNINVNVAGTNASADEIAQTVLTHLKRKERMTGAVTRV